MIPQGQQNSQGEKEDIRFLKYKVDKYTIWEVKKRQQTLQVRSIISPQIDSLYLHLVRKYFFHHCKKRCLLYMIYVSAFNYCCCLIWLTSFTATLTRGVSITEKSLHPWDSFKQVNSIRYNLIEYYFYLLSQQNCYNIHRQ